MKDGTKAGHVGALGNSQDIMSRCAQSIGPALGASLRNSWDLLHVGHVGLWFNLNTGSEATHVETSLRQSISSKWAKRSEV